jgi:hypothetical protein
MGQHGNILVFSNQFAQKIAGHRAELAWYPS